MRNERAKLEKVSEQATQQKVIYSAGHVGLTKAPELDRYRTWFKDSVDKMDDWRSDAKEDYGFYTGEAQWTNGDLEKLKNEKRPAITINRIRPQINVLCGYQRINRTDIDFLPRTNDDSKLCEVRKGVTKYVMDSSDYEYAENDVFRDGVVTGLGWFEVGYKFKYPTLDGDAFVRRESPFNIYVDSESRATDFSDAKYIIRAKWVDKEDLESVYPEYKEQIEAQQRIYDEDEQDKDEDYSDWSLYWNEEKRKLRLVECWYKEQTNDEFFILDTGETIRQCNMTEEIVNSGQVVGHMNMPVTVVKVATFFDQVLLEDKESPYEHGEFPFVPFVCYYNGEGDEPSGVVRGLKDVQREINKRRSQTLHILNTQANSGWIAERTALTPEQQAKLKESGSTPGTLITVADQALTTGRIREISPKAPPTNTQSATQEAENDMVAISGINESLMGTDVAANASGRAIELKQKQAVTQIVPILDNLRKAKKSIAYLLWGSRGHKGIIPQYYTEEKTFRIIGDNGKQSFMTVNQPQQQQDPLLGTINGVLNDLSQGEFDVVVADSPQSSTQRMSQFWSLTDAVQKLGVPGEMVFDIILQLSDIPNKEEILQRWQQKQQAQQEQQKAQQEQTQMLLQQRMELEKIRKLSQSINYKDADDPIRAMLAAKAGLLPQQLADIILENYAIRNILPLAQQNSQVMPMVNNSINGIQKQDQNTALLAKQQQFADLLNKLPPEQRQQALNNFGKQNNTQLADSEINQALQQNGQMPQGMQMANRVQNEQTKQLALSSLNGLKGGGMNG